MPIQMRHTRGKAMLPGAVGLLLLLTPGCFGGSISNAGFEIPGPNGPAAAFTGLLDGGPSAALSWGIWNNNQGTTETALCGIGACGPAGSPVEGNSAIHVITDADRSGIVQQFDPTGTGYPSVTSSLYLYVVSGTVGFGAGDGGNTVFDITLASTGGWVLVQTPNSNANSPVNEVILYASGGPAEFYADALDVQAVPEPSGLAALGMAVLALWTGIRRRG